MSDFKIGFGSDNHSGVHPDVFQALVDVNEGHAPSYGTDSVTSSTLDLFKQVFGQNMVAHFVFNGTAANVLCIKALLESHQSVICADTSHINIDECGAPEAISGCKLIPLPASHGKITVAQIKASLIRRGDQHFSQVGMVSITQPTELGTLYTLKELQEIREFTRNEGLLLHIDGARLIHAVHGLQVDFKALTSELGIDALSFGGTKNGLLMGEAVLFFDQPKAAAKFKFIRKQCLQLPSKMRFIAAQFQVLLGPRQLWKEIASKEAELAQNLALQISEIPGLEVCYAVESNVVFAKIPKTLVKPLRKKYFFYVWDEKEWIVRWMMSHEAEASDVADFGKVIKSLVEELRL